MNTISALWPDDVSDAIDTGYAAAVCYFNNPDGNIVTYVARQCDLIVGNLAENLAADGVDRRTIERELVKARRQYMETVRENFKEATRHLKKRNSATRRAVLIYRDFLTPMPFAAGMSREIATVAAKDFIKNSNSEAIRAQFLRQEKFDATK